MISTKDKEERECKRTTKVRERERERKKYDNKKYVILNKVHE